MNKRTHNFS